MTLTDVIDAYVLLQQSLGKRFESARTLLRRFSREVGNPHIQEVEAADLATFLRGSGPLSATWTLKYRVLLAGDKLFVDWAGDTVPIIDPMTGEVHEAFIAALGSPQQSLLQRPGGASMIG